VKSGGLAQIAGGDGVVPAHPVVVPGQSHQAQNCTVGLEAVDPVNQGGGRKIGAGRAVGGIQLGGLINILRLQAGDLADLIQWVLLHQRLVLLEAIGVFLNIVHVGPPVFQNEPGHPKGEGPVGSGVDLEEDIRQVLGCGGVADIDDDDLAAPFLEFAHPLYRQVVGIIPIVVPAQEGVGMGHVRRGTAAHGDLIAHFHGDGANAVVGSEIHAAEHMGEALVNGPVPLGVPAVKGHRVGRIGFLDLPQPFRDDLIGLIPGNRLKFSLTPRPDSA